MLGASASNATCADLAAIGDVLAKGRNIFVIDIGDLVAAEAAWLLLDLLEGCWRDLWFLLQRSIRTCSHCGAPFIGPAKRGGMVGFLEGWLVVSGGGTPTAAGVCRCGPGII